MARRAKTTCGEQTRISKETTIDGFSGLTNKIPDQTDKSGKSLLCQQRDML